VHDFRTMKTFADFTRRLLLKLVQKIEMNYSDLSPVPHRISTFSAMTDPPSLPFVELKISSFAEYKRS
jgi:hypothetical protein